MAFLKKLLRNKRGSVLVEYALLVAGIAVIAAAAVSVLGHKTSDMLGTAAAILPGVHAEENNLIASGEIIETAPIGPGDSIQVDVPFISTGGVDTLRLGNNIGTTNLEDLIVDTDP
ncbi:MAG: Flp family type IVb pilin [Planctomycetota bacterium]